MDKVFSVHVGVTGSGRVAELAMESFEEAVKAMQFSMGGVSLFVYRVDPCPCPAGIKGSQVRHDEAVAALTTKESNHA